MQTDPTARHSLIGSFQRVCYLVLWRATAGERQPWNATTSLHPYRRRARRRAQTEVTVDPSGVGVRPQGVRARLAPKPGSSGNWPGHQAVHLVCPVPT
jgi:hypothetical protein